MSADDNEAHGYTSIGDALGRTADDRVSQLYTRIKMWFLVDGNRLVVTTVLLLGVFGLTLLLPYLLPVSVQQFVFLSESTATVLLYFITGIITITTLVLTINQLVLSYQIGPISKQQQAVNAMLEHRDAATAIMQQDTSSEKPSNFLHEILSAIHHTVHAIDTDDVPDKGRDDFTAFQEEIDADTAPAIATLKQTRFGTSAFMAAGLQYQGSEKLEVLRTLKQKHGQQLSDTVTEQFDELHDALTTYVISEEYFKTAYLQTEFINFSKALVYISLPALILTTYIIHILDPGIFSGTTLLLPSHLLLSAAGITAAITPFTLLIAYVARLTTITETTVFSGPFLYNPLRDT